MRRADIRIDPRKRGNAVLRDLRVFVVIREVLL